MGCDIHAFAERKVGDRYEVIKGEKFSDGEGPFHWRSYGVFGFLAGVRNYSAIPPIAPDRGIPDDVSDEVAAQVAGYGFDGHSHTWVAVDELSAFNYDAAFEDRRVTRQVGKGAFDGGVTADAGGGSMTTFLEFLGEMFFDDLALLKKIGADRVVFFFDN